MHGSSIPNMFRTLERCFKISSFVAGTLCLVFSLTTQAQESEVSTEKILKKMSVDEKIGQLMVWTFGGKEFNAPVKELMSKYKLGAFIVFSRNIRSIPQIAKLNGEMQAFARKNLKAPLLIMVDQEGGTVTRVKVGTPIPSPLALAQAEDPLWIEGYAKTKGELLASAGFNMNLAPVLDITDASRDSFIANRAFSGDPTKVTEVAMAYSRGMNAAGIVPTAKHFPGHGGTVNDSHTSLPKKLASLEELEKKDLIPFLEFIGADFPRAIMMAHMSLPNIDPSGVPATYSPLIIQDTLRDKFGFTGLVITDDLEMGGASVSEDIGERSVRAFLAGNDLLMLAGHPRRQRHAFESMQAAVKSGRIPMARLNESVRRILELKLQPKFSGIKFERAKSIELKSKMEALSRDVMRKNFKSAMDSKSSAWPKIQAETRVVVFASDPRFFRSFKRSFDGKAEFFHLNPDSLSKVPSTIARENITTAVFYASGTGTTQFLNKLLPELRSKTIVVNCTNVGRVDQQETYLSVLNLNSHSPESGQWLAERLNAPSDLRLPAAKDELPAAADLVLPE